MPLVIFLLSLTPLVQTTQLHALYPHGELVPDHLLFNIKTAVAAGEYNEKPLTAIGIFAPATVNPTTTTTPARPGRKYKRVVCPPGFTRAGDIIPGLDSSIPTAVHDVPGPTTNGPSVEHVTATDTGGGTTPASQEVPSSAPSVVFVQFTVPGITSTPDANPSGEDVTADPSPSTPVVPVSPRPASQSTPTPNPPAPGASPQAGAPSAASIPSGEHVTETSIGGDPPSVPSIPPGSPPVSPPASPASPSISIPVSMPSKAHDVYKTHDSQVPAVSAQIADGLSSVPVLPDGPPSPPPQVSTPSAPTPDSPSNVAVPADRASSVHVEPFLTESASPPAIIPSSAPSVVYIDEFSIFLPSSTQTPDDPSSVPVAASPTAQGPALTQIPDAPSSVHNNAKPTPESGQDSTAIPSITSPGSPIGTTPTNLPSDLQVTEGPEIPASTANPSVTPSPPQFFVRQAITDPNACIPIPDDNPSGASTNGATLLGSGLQPSAITPNLPTPITTQVTFTTSESGTLRTGVTIVTTFPGLQEIQPVPITTHVTLTTSISGTLQTVVMLVTTTPPPVPIDPPQATTALITFTTSVSGTLQTVVTLVTTTPSLTNPTTESITYVTLISGTPETRVTVLTEEAFVGFATATATTTPFSAITILLDWPVPTTTSQSGFGGSFSTYRDGIQFWIGIMCGFIIMGVWL